MNIKYIGRVVEVAEFRTSTTSQSTPLRFANRKILLCSLLDEVAATTKKQLAKSTS